MVSEIEYPVMAKSPGLYEHLRIQVVSTAQGSEGADVIISLHPCMDSSSGYIGPEAAIGDPNGLVQGMTLIVYRQAREDHAHWVLRSREKTGKKPSAARLAAVLLRSAH